MHDWVDLQCCRVRAVQKFEPAHMGERVAEKLKENEGGAEWGAEAASCSEIERARGRR